MPVRLDGGPPSVPLILRLRTVASYIEILAAKPSPFRNGIPDLPAVALPN